MGEAVTPAATEELRLTSDRRIPPKQTGRQWRRYGTEGLLKYTEVRAAAEVIPARTG